MDSSIYVFGKLASGYTQYPDDYAKDIFNDISKRAKAPTQLVVHRDNDLIYYTYIRNLEEQKYIGICIVLNGRYITNLSELFTFFEDKIAFLAFHGNLIHYNDKGDITSSVSQLYQINMDVDIFTKSFRQDFYRFENATIKLPPINFSVSKEEVKEFDCEDDIVDIIQSSYTYSYTYIYKDRNYDTDSINSYKAVLHRVTTENNQLKEDNSKLKEKNKKILRQKKQMGVVLFLVFILFIGGKMSYDKIEDYSNTVIEKDKDISHQKDTIIKQKSANLELNLKNKRLNSDHNNLKDKYVSLEEDLQILEYRYKTLQTNYNKLSLVNKNMKSKIASLNSKNEAMFDQLSIYKDSVSHMRTNNIYAKTLLSQKNYYYDLYTKFREKYYSTKEGRKELRD